MTPNPSIPRTETNAATLSDAVVVAVNWSTRERIEGDFTRWAEMWGGETPTTPRGQRLRTRLKLLLHECGLRATLLYRLSYGCWRHRIPLLPGMLRRWNLSLHGIDIPPSVPIGPGLYVPHPVGTAIMAESIGRDVSIIHAVTIGMRNERAFPVIGDGVFIGAGARVLGGIRVGRDAKVGANAVVVKDVPDGASVVGIPARVLGTPSATPSTAEGATQ